MVTDLTEGSINRKEPVPRHHKPLEKRFHARLSEAAYANLRKLAERSCLGNNYVLTVILEDMDRVLDLTAFDTAVKDMLDRHRKEP